MYYKIGSGEYVDKTHITARHLNKVKALRALSPLMPIMQLTTGYTQKLNFHLMEVQAFYFYNNLKFKNAFSIYRELLNSLLQENIGARNETQLLNMFTISIAGEMFDEASKALTSLKDYYKRQQLKGRLKELFIKELRLEVFSFGKFPSDLKENKTEFLKQFIATTKDESRDDLLAEAFVTLLHFYLLSKDFNRVQRVLNNELFQLKANDYYKIYEKLFIPLSSLQNKERLKSFNATKELIISTFQSPEFKNKPSMATEQKWLLNWLERGYK